MDKEIQTWLFDILTSLEEIESYFEGTEKSFSVFSSDIKTIRAVERNLEIIGEAVKKIIRNEPTIALSNTKQIIGTRNIISHEYSSLSYQLIWSIINDHLPTLRKEVIALLKEK